MRLAALLMRTLRSTVALAAIAVCLSTSLTAFAVTTSVQAFGWAANLAAVMTQRPSVLARVSTDLDIQKKMNVQLKSELRRAQGERDALRRASVVLYRGERVALREAVEDTSRRVTRRVVAATTRNVASMPMEALPLVGIGAIVGATAWELSDACGLMKDMHELEVAYNPEGADDFGRREVCGKKVPDNDEIWAIVRESPGQLLQEAREHYDQVRLPGWDDVVEVGRWLRALLFWSGNPELAPEVRP